MLLILHLFYFFFIILLYFYNNLIKYSLCNKSKTYSSDSTVTLEFEEVL